MSENDLYDILQIRNPDHDVLHGAGKTSFKQRRLHFLLVSDSMQENFNPTDIITSVGPDHSVINIEFCSNKKVQFKGMSILEFNISLTELKTL